MPVELSDTSGLWFGGSWPSASVRPDHLYIADPKPKPDALLPDIKTDCRLERRQLEWVLLTRLSSQIAHCRRCVVLSALRTYLEPSSVAQLDTVILSAAPLQFGS